MAQFEDESHRNEGSKTLNPARMSDCGEIMLTQQDLLGKRHGAPGSREREKMP